MIVYKTWKSQLRICLIIWTPFPFLLFDMSLFTTFTTTHLYCLLLCKLSISLQIEWKCTSCWWRRKWMLSCSDSVALYLIDSWSIFSLNICLYLSHDFFYVFWHEWKMWNLIKFGKVECMIFLFFFFFFTFISNNISSRWYIRKKILITWKW